MKRVLLLCALLATPVAADHFDHYVRPTLLSAIEPNGPVKELATLPSEAFGQYDSVLADATGTFLIVMTNQDRIAKLFVVPARQRLEKSQVSLCLIEKFSTFKDGTERAVVAQGAGVKLFAGLRFDLDLGQVVPEKFGGDLEVVASEKDPLGFTLKPLGKAKMYVLTKAIPDVVPKKAAKLEIGATFEPRYFIGSYKLRDDGRRSGKLMLEVNESGEVGGSFYSDKDGQKYDVTGNIGSVRHSITFSIKFPQVEQVYKGHLFTGDGKAIAGTSKLRDREAAFYAERIDDEK